MNIQQYYDYVFGAHAESPKLDAKKIQRLKQENVDINQYQQKQAVKKAQEVRDFFVKSFKLIDLDGKLQNPLDPNLKFPNTFREVLRALA